MDNKIDDVKLDDNNEENITQFLNIYGYCIKITSLNKSLRADIRSDLTVRPINYIGYTKIYKIYSQLGEYYIVPRNYAIRKFCNSNVRNVKCYLNPGRKINFDITLPGFKLKPIQQHAYETIIKAFSQWSTATLNLDCGVGKTIVAIYLIHKLKLNAIVIVHRVTLLQQWKDKINEFTDASVGVIHRKTINYKDKDIVLTTVNNVIKHNYRDIYAQFGLSIFDEVHHLNGRVFYTTVRNVNTKYMLGLTATPDKGNPTINYVFRKFLSPVVPHDINGSNIDESNIDTNNTIHDANLIDVRILNKVIINIIKYTSDNKECTQQIKYQFVDKPNVGRMITGIIKNTARNKMILHYLMKIADKSDRNILVIGERISHLRYIYNALYVNDYSCGLFIGGMKMEDLEVSKTKQIILGTYSMCEESLDILKLNVLFLITPRRSIKQTIGRLRINHKVSPIPIIVVDIVDMFSKTFVNQGYARRAYYRKSGFNIRNINIHDKYKSNDENHYTNSNGDTPHYLKLIMK